jgi:ABC-type bacteriocin/lantibiotic exporter with double-glycine peptidase domain
MKPYHQVRQEKESWCLPTCLESILEYRDKKVSQEEIAKRLGINGLGFDFDLRKLKYFLDFYGLDCKFTNPMLELSGADLILQETFKDCDVLVAYDSGKLNDSKKIVKHVSLISDYNSLNDKIILYDPARKELVSLDLNKLVSAMPPREDDRYGFYLIR